jgi:hypothetical protein
VGARSSMGFAVMGGAAIRRGSKSPKGSHLRCSSSEAKFDRDSDAPGDADITDPQPSLTHMAYSPPRSINISYAYVP